MDPLNLGLMQSTENPQQNQALSYLMSQMSEEEKKKALGSHIIDNMKKQDPIDVGDKLSSVMAQRMGQNTQMDNPLGTAISSLGDVPAQSSGAPSGLSKVVGDFRQQAPGALANFMQSFGRGMTGMPIDQSAPNAGWQTKLGGIIGNEFGQSALRRVLYGREGYEGRKPFSDSPSFINTPEKQSENKVALEQAEALLKVKDIYGTEDFETARRDAAKLGIPSNKYMKDGKVDKDTLYNEIAIQAAEGTKREQRLANQKAFQQSTEIRKEFNNSPLKKEYDTISQFYKSAEKAYGMATAKDKKSLIASDQALGVFLAKILDPNSVVMPSELERTPQQAALFNKLYGFIPKLQKGGLGITDADRKAIIEMSKAVYDVAGERYDSHLDRYQSLATEYGLNPKTTLGDIKRHNSKGTQNVQSQAQWSQTDEQRLQELEQKFGGK